MMKEGGMGWLAHNVDPMEAEMGERRRLAFDVWTRPLTFMASMKSNIIDVLCHACASGEDVGIEHGVLRWECTFGPTKISYEHLRTQTSSSL